MPGNFINDLYIKKKGREKYSNAIKKADEESALLIFNGKVERIDTKN